MRIRAMQASDAEAVAAIYNEGIRGRGATFRTNEQTAADVAPWVDAAGRYPVVVAEDGDGALLGWARAGSYSEFPPYAGVGELAIYVTAQSRGSGVGRALVEALADVAREQGYWKLIAKVFPANEASVSLLHRCGWRDVGRHLRHGSLDGEWLDVLLLEKSL
jgi:L-amino acid N-acyltransferase YncA